MIEYEAAVRWTYPDGSTISENIVVMARNQAEARLRVYDELRMNYQPGGKIVLVDKAEPRFSVYSLK